MKKVMIADDDPSIVEVLSMILQADGYNIITDTDGPTVKTVIELMPDLLLLDIRMSGEDGVEVAKYLKGNVKTKNIPIILISANRDVKESAQKCGADDYIVKPFDMDGLLQKVAFYTKDDTP